MTSGPAIERQGDLETILTNLGDNDVLFIDEIHRLSKTVEEILYSAMEDFALDIIIGKGPGSQCSSRFTEVYFDWCYYSFRCDSLRLCVIVSAYNAV